VKFRLGRFERPTKLAVSSGLASVDLRSGCVREQNNFFARWRLNRVGHVRPLFFHGSVFGLRTGDCGSQHENADPDEHGNA
jgi:hypothetical protein